MWSQVTEAHPGMRARAIGSSGRARGLATVRGTAPEPVVAQVEVVELGQVLHRGRNGFEHVVADVEALELHQEADVRRERRQPCTVGTVGTNRAPTRNQKGGQGTQVQRHRKPGSNTGALHGWPIAKKQGSWVATACV